MATVTIRNLPDDVKSRLRVRAARHGRSMEAEARALLTAATADQEQASRDSVNEVIQEVQAAFAPYKVPGTSLVDELIAERRAEAWQETLEEQEWQRQQGRVEQKTDSDG